MVKITKKHDKVLRQGGVGGGGGRALQADMLRVLARDCGMVEGGGARLLMQEVEAVFATEFRAGSRAAARESPRVRQCKALLRFCFE